MVEQERSNFENFLFQLYRLEEQGFNLAKLPDEVFERLVELIDREDEKRLTRVREDLQELFGENIQITNEGARKQNHH